MLIKWLITSLMLTWLYHALVRPWFVRHFAPPQAPPPPPHEPRQGTYFQQNPNSPQPKKYPEDDGEYIDYEEVK